MASVDELRLIRGFDAKTVAALVPYVTVLPATSNNVNVNTASPEMLAALVQGLDLPTAQRIAEERLGKPFKRHQRFQVETAARPRLRRLAGMDVKTDFFLVVLDTSIGRHERRSEALLQRLPSKTTTVIWHRPQPLIGGGLQPSSGSDEPDESR